MGKFSNQSFVSFGPITKLCLKFLQGNKSLSESCKGKSMTYESKDESNETSTPITSFLGKLAYAAQAQEFVNNNSVSLNLNEALLFSSYRGQNSNINSNFYFNSDTLATRIGCGPLYKR